MLPLQWVAVGLLLVLLDAGSDGWDALPDPLGWVAVVLGLLRVRHRLGTGPVAASVVALVVALVAYPPGLLVVTNPALSWALSLPQVAACAWLSFAAAEAQPARRSSWRLAGWLLVVVGMTPVLVLGGGPATASLAGVAAFLAVGSLLYLVYLLLTVPDALEEPHRDVRTG